MLLTMSLRTGQTERDQHKVKHSSAGVALTFRASNLLNVLPQPWQMLFWDLDEWSA